MAVLSSKSWIFSLQRFDSWFSWHNGNIEMLTPAWTIGPTDITAFFQDQLMRTLIGLACVQNAYNFYHTLNPVTLVDSCSYLTKFEILVRPVWAPCPLHFLGKRVFGFFLKGRNISEIAPNNISQRPALRSSNEVWFLGYCHRICFCVHRNGDLRVPMEKGGGLERTEDWLVHAFGTRVNTAIE